jgi:hypothetical protein
MSEYPDRRVWSIENHEVTYLHIDYRFAFDCWWADNNLLSVIIETPFTIRFPDRTVTCEPADVSSLKEAIPILHKPLSMLTAYRDGRLLVTFSDSTELDVSKHPHFESWQVHGKGEFQDIALHCTPNAGPPWKV